MTKENKVAKTATTNAKPRNKKLTLKKIEAEYKKIHTMSTFEYDPKDNIVIKYYEIFPEEKIEELLIESHKTLEYIEENELEPFKSDEDFYKYLGFLIIKHMTELKNKIPDDFPSQISIMSQMISTGLYRKLLNSMFNENEVAKVYDRVVETSEKITQLNELIEKEMSKLNKLQNKDIISKPFNVMSNPTGLLQ